MARPRLLVGIDAPPQPRSQLAVRLRALAQHCDLVLCAASPGAQAGGYPFSSLTGETYRVALSQAASAADITAVVLMDGPAARAALKPGRIDLRTRVVLWSDESSLARANALPGRRNEPLRNPPAWPDQIWWTGPRGSAGQDELIPAAYWSLTEDTVGAFAARFAGQEPARPIPARGLTTIVIPCWNGLADTRICLDAVLRNTGVPFEVVVVDNGSVDGTARYARSLRDRRVRVLRNETNLGFAKAVNRGLAAARGKYAVWLNNDCFVTPGWLELLQNALERAPWIGAVGPMTDGACALQKVGGKPPSARDLPRYAAAWSMSHRGRMAWAHRLEGFCILHRTELLRRMGFLDEKFGMGTYEDFDWCLRVRQAGYELYVAEDVYVAHRGHATFDKVSEKRMDILRRNRDLFVEKWCHQGLKFLDELDAALVMARMPARRKR